MAGGVTQAQGVVANDPTIAAITGGSITGVQGLIGSAAQWAIPFIYLASGSMGNNGALTVGTALPFIPDMGAWVRLPAGAIAAGVPAAEAWYWCVFSSNTVGTVYNSTYTSGTPAAGVATAFSTTGPGAYTSSISSEIAGPVINVAANGVGPNGRILYDYIAHHASNANTKNYRAHYSGSGGTQISLVSCTTSSAAVLGEIKSMGVTNRQVSRAHGTLTQDTNGIAFPQVDQTAASTLALTFQKGVATDNMLIVGGSVAVAYGA